MRSGTLLSIPLKRFDKSLPARNGNRPFQSRVCKLVNDFRQQFFVFWRIIDVFAYLESISPLFDLICGKLTSDKSIKNIRYLLPGKFDRLVVAIPRQSAQTFQQFLYRALKRREVFQ